MKGKLDRKAVVEEVKRKLQDAQVIILTDFRGLNVHELGKLRNQLLESGIEYKVVKNTLLRIAAHDCNFEKLDEFLTGPTALAFGFHDPVAPAKVLFNFSREHEFLKIKGGVLNREVLDASRVIELANLPSREELLSRLLGSIQAPLAGLVNVLHSPLRGLVTCLNAIANKGGELNA